MRIQCFLLAGWLFFSVTGTAGADPLIEVSGLLNAGHYKEAEAQASLGLADPAQSGPAQSRLYIARGLARQAQGENEDALVDFTQGLSGRALPARERAVALFDRGVSLDSMGRLDDAIGDYSAALGLAPDMANARNNRANVYRRQGRLDDARRDYLAALTGEAVHAQYPDYGLGQIAEATGDRAAARDFYAKALAADPGYQPAADRLQALGADDWTVPDSSLIVLRPPPAAAPIVLRPPPPRTEEAMDRELKKVAQRASPKPAAPARLQAPMRPAIVEKAGTGPLAQLGAWRSEDEAQGGWAQAQKQAGSLLDGLTPMIVAVDLPDKGRYYRLQLIPRMPASQFCAMLVARGHACFPVRN